MAAAGVPIPPEALVEAAPNLRNKDKILQAIEAAKSAPNPARDLGQKQAEADIEHTAAQAALTGAKAQTEAVRAAMAGQAAQQYAPQEYAA